MTKGAKHRNLATLSEQERAAIELHRQVCLARFVCRGKSRIEVDAYLATLDEATSEHIRGLMRG
jgi:hypothetical protein